MTTIQISANVTFHGTSAACAEVEALLREGERELRRMDRMALIAAAVDAEAAYRDWPTDYNWQAFCEAYQAAWEVYPQNV